MNFADIFFVYKTNFRNLVKSVFSSAESQPTLIKIELIEWIANNFPFVRLSMRWRLVCQMDFRHKIWGKGVNDFKEGVLRYPSF